MTESGIAETVVKNEKQLPAYYLKEQRIGYLKNKNEWVDKNGIGITNFDNFERILGEKVQAIRTASHEKYVYIANL